MRVVVAGDVAVLVPDGATDWDAAMWINPGLMPDEYQVFDVIHLTVRDLDGGDDAA